MVGSSRSASIFFPLHLSLVLAPVDTQKHWGERRPSLVLWFTEAFCFPSSHRRPSCVLPLPKGMCHRLQWPAVTQSLPQAVEEGRPPAIPAWVREEKSLPATPNRNKLNYVSGEVRKRDDSSPLKAGRSKLVHGISAVLICSALWAGGSCDAPFCHMSPGKRFCHSQ